MHIGFIGLGTMGQAIALRVLAAGHTVKVWNRSAEASTFLEQQGAIVVGTPALAFACEVVISMLADDEAVRAVLSENRLFQHGVKGGIHINMATISVALSDELESLHQEVGMHYVAAPVIGRSDSVVQGKLNILAAGPAEASAKVQPIFDAIGQKTWHVGSTPSHANALKLAANFMLAAAIESTGEAFSLLSALGLPKHTFLEIMANTLFPGPVYQGYGQLMIAQHYEPALFSAKLGLKDIRLAKAAGAMVNEELPLADLLQAHLDEIVEQGSGEKDIAVLGERTTHSGRKSG